MVLMPLQKVTSALSGGIGSVWEKYTSIDEVMEQNEQLEAENAELRQQIVDYDRIKAENEATRRWPAFRIPTPKQAIFLPL